VLVFLEAQGRAVNYPFGIAIDIAMIAILIWVFWYSERILQRKWKEEERQRQMEESAKRLAQTERVRIIGWEALEREEGARKTYQLTRTQPRPQPRRRTR
jgi:hypothetical protein